MVFKSLKVKNFRGIKTAEIEDLNQINLFVGRNNSGKSSVLESVFLLVGISNAELLLRIDNFRKLIHTEENDFRFIFYNLKYQNNPEIEGVLFKEEGFRKIVVKPNATTIKSSESIELSLSRTESISDSNSSSFFDSVNSLSLEGEIKKRQTQKKIIKSSISMERKEFNKINFSVKPPRDYKEDVKGIFLNSELSHVGTHKRIEDLIIQKKKTFLLENLQLIDPSIIDVTTGSNNMIYFDIGAERLLPSNMLGDGINKIISIVSALNELKHGILLIDEIDNGLHFSALVILWKLIFTLCIENDIQIFLTTHNFDVLKYLVKFIESDESLDKKYSQLISCYSLSKIRGNEIKSYKYNFEELSYSVHNNIEIRGNESN